MWLEQVVGICVLARDTGRPLSWEMVESGGGLGGVDCPSFQQLPWLGLKRKLAATPLCSASWHLSLWEPSRQEAQLSVTCKVCVNRSAFFPHCGDCGVLWILISEEWQPGERAGTWSGHSMCCLFGGEEEVGLLSLWIETVISDHREENKSPIKSHIPIPSRQLPRTFLDRLFS